MAEPKPKPLRVLRKERDLTQEELAEAAGVSVASLTLWENGKRTPKVEQIRKLAKALETTEEEVLASLREPPKKKRGKSESSQDTRHTYQAGSLAFAFF